MNFSKITGLLIILVFFSLIVIILWLSLTSRSILLTFGERGSVSKVPSFALFNPFRDRKIEVMGDAILNSVRNGNCNSVVSELGRSDRYKSLCENLTDDPIKEWSLAFREDGPENVSLFYRTKRNTSQSFDGEIGITFCVLVEPPRIVDIGPIY